MTEVQITAELLDELDGKAKEATPGPWGQDGYLVCRTRHEDGTTYIESWRPAAEANTVDDARFIAAANPATILALTAHIRSMTEQLEKAEKDAARYRWLRDQCSTLGRLTIARCTAYEIYGWSGDDPDRAIDTAIAQEADHE